VSASLTVLPALALTLVQVLRERTEAQVLYGPSTQQLEDRVISLGLGDEDTVVGFETTQNRQQGLGRGARETVTLHGFLSVVLGDSDGEAVQFAVEEATALLEVVASALEDPRLRALASALDLGPSISWLPVQNDRGAACGIFFDIVAQALLRPRT
jgi:hypothetical protein